MVKKIKKSVIVVFIIGIIIEIFREISGNGLISIIQCSNDYYFNKCVGIGTDSPVNLMHDFFSLQEEKKITKAWNLLSKDQQYNFTHVRGAKRDKNYFHNFWDREVSDFVVFKSSYERINEKTAEIEFKICYVRDDIYLAKYSKKNFSKRFCSKDNYLLINKQKEKSPYKWSIDTMGHDKCSNEDIKICKSYNFNKKYIKFSE